MKKHYFLPALIMALFSGSLMAETLLTVNGNKIDSREIDRQIKLIRQDNPQISDSPELRNDPHVGQSGSTPSETGTRAGV